MTEEEALAQATSTIESNKPMRKNVNGVVSEFSEEDYAQSIEDLKNSLLNDYNFGYIEARQVAYKSVTDQLDQLYKAVDAGLFGEDAKTAEWYTDIKTVKTDNPKPE